jgi:hypothetical protein
VDGICRSVLSGGTPARVVVCRHLISHKDSRVPSVLSTFAIFELQSRKIRFQAGTRNVIMHSERAGIAPSV